MQKYQAGLTGEFKIETADAGALLTSMADKISAIYTKNRAALTVSIASSTCMRFTGRLVTQRLSSQFSKECNNLFLPSRNYYWAITHPHLSA